MIDFSSPLPGRVQNLQNFTPEVKISLVKVPTGAKQIGNYILGKTLGSGSFGKVHLGLNIPTGEKVAIKIIQKSKLNSKDLQRVHRQINILKSMLHPSVIQLYQIIETQKSLLLIMQYMQNGELFKYIVQHKKLSEKKACEIFHQIIQAIQYLHQMGVSHRDLKPENILMDFDDRIKIIDFGLSNIYKEGEKLKTECGSPCYAAPEMIQGKHRYIPIKIDIWSAGIVLFAMVCGYLPFCDHDTQKLYKKILSGSYKFPQWISPQIKQLLTMMLKTNPKQRANLNQIISHPWYNKITWNKGYGIDGRFYKIPFQRFIINDIFTNKTKVSQILHKIQTNQKTKQTAIYYLIVKKLTKQGHKIKTYFGSLYFDTDSLKPFSQEDDSGTVTGVQCIQNVQAIAPENKEQAPVTSSSLSCFTKKSPQFQKILKQFMVINPPLQKDEQLKKKQIFYAFNLENQKKRQSLKAKTAKQKAINLFHLHKPHHLQKPQSIQSLNPKTSQQKKSMIEVLHSLNNKSTNEKSHPLKRIRTQISTNQLNYHNNSCKKQKTRLPSLFQNSL